MFLMLQFVSYPIWSILGGALPDDIDFRKQYPLRGHLHSVVVKEEEAIFNLQSGTICMESCLHQGTVNCGSYIAHTVFADICRPGPPYYITIIQFTQIFLLMSLMILIIMHLIK